ncbi:uncharacterized protein LOC121737581 isoform X1 [Aricia agestis]|uniref:uncharacterized protein LOC121737581 isoform X1 n=1 Tax=Aricia agestis TaxID=91739 RepID=UPI001C20B47B|nr:uncharacterized protein LOC121737581 isoform X1 [Aricia agestis]
MSDEEEIKFNVPIIKKESEVQTVGREITKSPVRKRDEDMADNGENQTMSIRKRRNLSKNRGLNAREKTPEPGRTPIPHEDTTTTDEEDNPQRTSREIEADNTYEEMKRLVLEQAKAKDPVYDLNTDEILEARAMEANERRRRSISPFALPDKDEISQLERKLSFVDPTNKLLSTNYCVTLKDEDSKRRNSLTLDMPPKLDSIRPSSANVSPKDKDAPFQLPSTPKKLEQMVYPDELTKKKPVEDSAPKEVKKEPIPKPPRKISETPPAPGELVTKVIQVERTPSKKLAPDQKPAVEVRERIVRTPSRKLPADTKPTVTKQIQNKAHEQPSEEPVQPPVKPARSKSASRFGNKTSESEMSEDQLYNRLNGAKRKVVPTPRRFLKKSPRANRSNSVNRVEDVKVVDKTGTGMSQTSLEIIEMMQKARARSLSIPKDDSRLPSAYKGYTKVLETPNKTPSSLRNTRGISCPKTIQIISDKEILSGLNSKRTHRRHRDYKKHSRQSSGYVEASQSEYTSTSCYTSSGSENEYEFDLSVKTAELTRKLHLLSREVDEHEAKCNIMLSSDSEKKELDPKSVLRKRSIAAKNVPVTPKEIVTEIKRKTSIEKPLKQETVKKRSRWTLIANWQQFKDDNRIAYNKLISLRNRCICNLLLLIFMCGLGGMMFKTLEGSFENAYKCSTRNVKRDFIENLWRGSHYLREEDWKSMARKKLYEFEDQLHTAHEAGVTSYSGQRSWNFMNSFVYCLTLVTTIGYGHIAPKTTYGRVATIIYAIIGIPLFLIVLADFGKLFTRIIKFFWAYIRRFYYTRSCRRVRRTGPVQEVMKGLNIVYEVVRRPSQVFSEEDIEVAGPPVERKTSDAPPPLPPKPGVTREVEVETDPGTPAPSVFEIDDEFNLPISVAIFILVVYIIIGAIGYNMWETWSFFESFYFVFISMSTIGLGDLVPDHPMFMMASILYLVFGLALTSMCINVVQVKLSDTFRQASAKLGATIGLKVAEEDGSLVPITPPPVEIAPVHKPNNIEESKIKGEETKEDVKNR